MGYVLITIVQFVISVILAGISAYLGIWLFDRATRDIDEWKALGEGNTAVGITLAAVVLGMAIILRPAIAGALPFSSGRLAPDVGSTILPLLVLALMLTRVLLGLLLGVAAIFFAIWLFLRLTRDLDEMVELRNGNTAVAATLSGVILAVSILISPVVTGITDGLLVLFVG